MSSRVIEQEGDFNGFEGAIGESIYSREYVFNYGVVDTELVETLINIAEAKRNEQ